MERHLLRPSLDPQRAPGHGGLPRPPTCLSHATAADPPSQVLVRIYGAWVASDLWWTLRLWQLNPQAL